ncbi:MAG: 6-pyruvoyl trahydropterin synthase family protein [Candidatus Binatia bacterium]
MKANAVKSPFHVHVFKDYLKFSAAHFIAYRGFREPLHGHNYQVSVRIEGELGEDGYVLDFGLVKKAARRICEALDERVILPAKSDCIELSRAGGQVVARYEDGATFSFPEADTALLPIVHSSAEELARYVLSRLREELPDLRQRGVRSVEVGVAEAPGQVAYYRESP